MRKIVIPIIFFIAISLGVQIPKGEAQTEYAITDFSKIDLDGKLTLNYLDKSSLTVNQIYDSKSALNINLATKSATFTYEGYDLKCYELDKDNVEYGLLFKEALKTNIVNFQLDLVGLKAYYQDSLLNELNLKDYDYVNDTHALIGKEVMVYRPVNIVDSYAFYNSSGYKLYHLYRSKIIDSKGLETYCKYKLDGNILSIIIPLEFLEKAIYPIFLDPEFGKTDIGGSTFGTWTLRTYVFYIDPNTSGTLTEIHAYISNGDGDDLKSGLWTTDGTYADDRLTLSTATTVTSTAQWWVFDVVDYDFSDTPYWFGVGTFPHGVSFHYDSSSAPDQCWGSGYDNGDPDSQFSYGGLNQGNIIVSIHGVYTSGAETFYVELTLGLDFGFNAYRNTSQYRELNLGINFDYDAYRNVSYYRLSNLNIVLVNNAYRNISAYRYTTLGINPAFTVERNMWFERLLDLGFNLGMVADVNYTDMPTLYATQTYVVAVGFIFTIIILCYIVVYRD